MRIVNALSHHEEGADVNKMVLVRVWKALDDISNYTRLGADTLGSS